MVDKSRPGTTLGHRVMHLEGLNDRLYFLKVNRAPKTRPKFQPKQRSFGFQVYNKLPRTSWLIVGLGPGGLMGF